MKSLYSSLFLLFSFHVFAQNFYYYDTNLSNLNKLLYYDINNCQKTNWSVSVPNYTIDQLLYRSNNHSLIYECSAQKLLYYDIKNNTHSNVVFFQNPILCKNFIGKDDSLGTTNRLAIKNDTIVCACVLEIDRFYRIDLKTGKTEQIGYLPSSIKGYTAICYHNNVLYGIGAGTNNIFEINTKDIAKSKNLFTLPPKFAGYYFTAMYEIEDCDSSYLCFVDPVVNDGIYKLDFFKQDLVKLCDTKTPNIYNAAAPSPYLSCLDLDFNNSTTFQPKDYATVLCQSGTVPLHDLDLRVKTRPGYADSLHVWLSKGVQDIGNETLTILGALPTGVTMKKNGNDFWFVFPSNFKEMDIENLIKQLRYTNSKTAPSVGEREITFYLYANGVVSDPAVAHINIAKPIQTNQNISSCTGKTLIINGINIKKDTSFCLKLKGKEGCDSTHCYTITFSAQQKGIENKSFCFGESYTFDGTVYNNDQIFQKTLKSSQDCDSLVTYNFKILAKKERKFSATICSGQTYDFYGKKLFQSGDYQDTLKTSQGCDSLEKLTLIVLPKKERKFFATICDGQSYDFYGKKLTQSGDYQDTLKTSQGCDSLEKLTLIVLAKKERKFSATICDGQSYDFYGKKLTQSGDYQDTLKTSQGCDSLEKLTLIVLSKKERKFSATICDGQSYDFYGKKLTQSVDYQEVLKTSQGCDSLEKLTLIVLLKKERKFSATICSGQTYNFYGTQLTQSGDYQEVLKTLQGCDSLEKLTLIVLPKKERKFSATICSGQSYDFYGKKLFQSGDYQDILKTSQGCDSLEKLTLIVSKKPVLTLPQDLTISEGTNVTLKAIVKADSLKSIFWSPDDFLNKNDALEVISTPTENVVYQVLVKDKNNCEASDTVRVFLQGGKKIFAPTAFSPNEDGSNDTFEIFVKPGEGKVTEYEIYDRWGSKIYQSQDPWNGKDAASGTYIFKAKIVWKDGKEKVIGGEVMLLR